MRLRPLLLSLVTMLTVVACSGSGASGGPSGAPGDGTAAGLDGRTFLSTASTGRVLVAGSAVRLAFKDGSIGASAGCNSMSGAYRLEGNILRTGQLATTEMACDPALMAQDAWVAELLDGAGITLDGNTLTLAREGVTLTLLDREAADPDRPLVGTRWVLDGLVSADAVSSVPLGITASLAFSDGGVAVETGCNTGSATVAMTPTTLRFGPLGLTKMACDGPAMAVERAVTAVLAGEVRYAIEAGTLTLDAGGRGLVLRAQS